MVIELLYSSDPRNPIQHDPLDTELHRYRRRRASDARTRQSNHDDSGVPIDRHQLDVASIGDYPGANIVDDLGHRGMIERIGRADD